MYLYAQQKKITVMIMHRHTQRIVADKKAMSKLYLALAKYNNRVHLDQTGLDFY